MRKVLLIIMILYFLGWIFFKSNTIETRQWTEINNGIEYQRTSYSLNWGNFIKFSKDIYDGTVSKLKKSFPRKSLNSP